jgi:P4 family phage/plasmid primase-like protien
MKRWSFQKIEGLTALDEPVKIPDILVERLKPFGPRYIKVAPPEAGDSKSGKKAVEHEFQKHPYEADNPELQAWLEHGGNYGILAGENILLLDTDDKETGKKLDALKTFTVQSGRGESGKHFYFRSDATENGMIINPETHENLGNIQAHDKFVVGPGCKHWTGGVYKIINDAPLAYVTKKQLEEIFGDKLQWAHQQRTEHEEEAAHEKTQAQIPLEKLIDLSQLRATGHGEYQGSHPIHGSQTGQNFCVNTDKGVWHCFRCNSGGGGLMWIAVKDGVIQCHEAQKGVLRGAKFLEALEFAKKEGFDVNLRDEKIDPDVARFYEIDEHGRPKFMPAFVANELLKENVYVTQKSNMMSFRYNPQNGVYELFAEAHIQQETRRKLGKHLSINRHREIEHFIKSSTMKDMPSPPEDLIVVANGVLNVKTGRLEPFSPDFFMFNALPVRYDPNADCPRFKTFLGEVIPSAENIRVLQEFVGYCLTRNCKFEKAIMLVGGGANGKTTFLKVLIKTLGKQNVSTMPLQIISNNRFALAELYGKMANIYPELPAVALRDTGLFKALVTGEMISGEKKFMGRFDFVPYSKLAFSCNEMPQTPDNTDAFFRRWVILPFPIQFLPDNPKTDPNLEGKLTTPEELSGILNWALQGLARLLQQGKFSISETVEETRDRYTLLSNSEKAFAERALIVATGKEITKEATYLAYIRFCQEHGLPTISKNAFSMELPRYIACMESLTRIHGKATRVWRDIQLKENEDSNKSNKGNSTPITEDELGIKDKTQKGSRKGVASVASVAVPTLESFKELNDEDSEGQGGIDEE